MLWLAVKPVKLGVAIRLAGEVITPWISRSSAVVLAASKTYQVPVELAAPQLMMRKVTVLPAGTFCNAAMPERSMGTGIEAPLLELEE